MHTGIALLAQRLDVRRRSCTQAWPYQRTCPGQLKSVTALFSLDVGMALTMGTVSSRMALSCIRSVWPQVRVDQVSIPLHRHTCARKQTKGDALTHWHMQGI